MLFVWEIGSVKIEDQYHVSKYLAELSMSGNLYHVIAIELATHSGLCMFQEAPGFLKSYGFDAIGPELNVTSTEYVLEDSKLLRRFIDIKGVAYETSIPKTVS